MREIRRARELDPFSVSINSFLVLTFYYAHQYDRALQAAKDMADIDPSFRGSVRRTTRGCTCREGYVWRSRHALEQIADVLRAGTGRSHIAARRTRTAAIVDIWTDNYGY